MRPFLLIALTLTIFAGFAFARGTVPSVGRQLGGDGCPADLLLMTKLALNEQAGPMAFPRAGEERQVYTGPPEAAPNSTVDPNIRSVVWTMTCPQGVPTLEVSFITTGPIFGQHRSTSVRHR